MVQVKIQRELAAIQLELAIDVDVQNYDAIVRDRRGRLAGLLSGLPFVRSQVDATLHAQIATAVGDGLDERLRPDVLTQLEQGLSDDLSTRLREQLAENDVVADVRVSVHAR